MTAAAYSIISVLIVSLISFVGLLTLIGTIRLKKKSLFFLVSFAAGALLGDVFIHLLPQLGEDGSLNLNTSLYILAAIIILFVVEKYIHWHHHANENDEAKHTKPFVITNLVGDGIHNLIDGMVIAGAYLIDFKLGVATTVAVVLHEIPQEFADFGVLIYGGLKPYKALFYNFLSALMSLAGALIVLLAGMTQEAVTMLVAFGAGSFIYLATADLIPEIHQEKEKTFTQLMSFAMGIVIMFALLYLE